MATVNRYTQIQPAQYNPMSLEELMMVPMMKRKEHDMLLSNVAATQQALAQTDYMDMHGEKVMKLRKQLEDDLQRQVDEVSANGISDSLKTDFMGLNAKYQNAVGPKGILGQAEAAKRAVAENRAELLANAVQMGHDPVETAKQFDKALAAYEESQKMSDEITNMNPVYAPKFRSLDEDLLRVKQMLGETVKTEAGEEGYAIQRDDTTGALIMVTDSGKVIRGDNFKQLKEANDFLQREWLAEGSEGYRSASWNGMDKEQLKEKINSGLGIMERSSVQDNRRKDYKVISKAEENQRKRDAGDLSYINAPLESIEIFNNDLADDLGRVLSGETHGGGAGFGLDHKDSATNQQAVRDQRGKEGTAYSFDRDLSDKQKETYQEIFSGLVNGGQLPTTIDPKSPEAMEAVRSYVDKYKTTDFNNTLITSDVMTTYGGNSIGINSSDPKKIGNSVYLTADKRTYYDPKNKEIISYDDLSDEVKRNLHKAEGSGYYSPKNVWTETIAKDSHRAMFVSPIEIVIPTEDGPVTLLASRQDSEMNSPAYRADTEFNNIYAKTNTKPNLPFSFTVGGEKVNVMKLTRDNPRFVEAQKQALNQAYLMYAEEYPNKSKAELKSMAVRKVQGQSIYVSNDAENGEEPMYMSENMLYDLTKSINGITEQYEQ